MRFTVSYAINERVTDYTTLQAYSYFKNFK